MESKSLTLIVTDLRTRRLAGLKKGILRGAIKNCRHSMRSYATWNVLLPSEDLASKLSGNNITTKYFRLQPEYRGKRTIRVTVCNILIQLIGDVLAAYLSKYDSVEAVTPLKSFDGTTHSDYIFTVCLDAFRAYFCDRPARCPDFPVQEFRSYLSDFCRLREAEAASCEGLVTECKVHDALKQVGFNKSSGLEGLSYEVYLRRPHMIVPILTDMFNHRFAQGTIPHSVTKGVITLLKKGDRHIWEDLDDYRPITLLNTEIKILARVLPNRLQLVISDLIGLDRNYAVKGRSVQDNLHLVHKIRVGLEGGTEAALINLESVQGLR